MPHPERKQTSLFYGPGASITSSITRVEKRIDPLFRTRERKDAWPLGESPGVKFRTWILSEDARQCNMKKEMMVCKTQG